MQVIMVSSLVLVQLVTMVLLMMRVVLATRAILMARSNLNDAVDVGHVHCIYERIGVHVGSGYHDDDDFHGYGCPRYRQ